MEVHFAVGALDALERLPQALHLRAGGTRGGLFACGHGKPPGEAGWTCAGEPTAVGAGCQRFFWAPAAIIFELIGRGGLATPAAPGAARIRLRQRARQQPAGAGEQPAEAGVVAS